MLDIFSIILLGLAVYAIGLPFVSMIDAIPDKNCVVNTKHWY